MRKRSFNQKFMAAVLAAALAFTSIEAMPAYAQSTEDAESIMEVSELTEATSEQNADIPALAEADDVPDTPDQAEELPMGQEIRRGIQPGAARDVDYFKFTTSDNPEIYYFLTVSNRGNNDFALDVSRDPDFVNADILPGAKGLRVGKKDTKVCRLQKLEANHTYYVRVQKTRDYDEEVPYTLLLAQQEDDVKDSVADAAVHPLDQAKTWAFQDADDVDVFQFTTLSDPDVFYKITWSYAGVASSWANISMYEDADYFKSVFKNQGADSGKTATWNLRKLQPNHTYYLNVNLSKGLWYEEDYQPKSYSIHIETCKDDVKDDGANAAKIEVGKKVSKALQNQYDQDVFKFTTPDTDSFYWLDATSLYEGGSLLFSLFDNQDLTGEPLLRMTVDSKKTNSQRLVKLKRKKEYYVRAELYSDGWGYDSYTGFAPYHFTVTSRLDDVNNKINNGDDKMKNATALKLSQKVTKALQDNDDVDYFTFTTTKDENFYKMSFDNVGNCSMSCEIWDNNNFVGQAVDSQTIESKKSTVFNFAKLKKKHTYYVIVKVSWSDRQIRSEKYMMKLTASKDDVKDTVSSAKTLTLNKTAKFGLQNKADVDWFKFKTTGYTTYTVDFSNIKSSEAIQIIVYSGKETLYNQILLDEYCSEKRSVDPGRAVLKLKPGRTYYVKVAFLNSYWAPDSGKYQLGIHAQGPASAKTQKAVKKKKPRVTLSWTKVNKADGYYIYRAQKKGKTISYKLYKTIKKGSIVKFVDTKVKKKQTYYYKIQAYKNKKGGKDKSAFSPARKVKI